jgi:hypothetical protein
MLRLDGVNARVRLLKNLNFDTDCNLVFNGNGTKFGTATAQKMAFWNATPVVQQARPTDAASIITLLVTLGLCA